LQKLKGDPMSFRDCMVSAADQGVISRKEAADMADRFDELYGQFRMNLGDDAARAEAKAALEAELRAAAESNRRTRLLMQRASASVKTNLQSYRGSNNEPNILEAVMSHLEHYGFAGFSSVEGRSKAIIGQAHAKMESALTEFRRTFVAGRRLNRAKLENMVAASFGEKTEDVAAAKLAETWSTTAEDLRQRFNAAGGEIGKLTNWGLPQSHDALALVKAGKDAWKTRVTELLDRARMVDPLSGKPLDDFALDRLLNKAYARIVSGGAVDIEAAMTPLGKGAISAQRAEHRVLIFKDAKSWLAYADEFGEGDPFAAMMRHVRGMANDIAAMEILGPNPQAMINWMKQVVEAERGKAIAGRPTLWRRNSLTTQAGRAIRAMTGGKSDAAMGAALDAMNLDPAGRIDALWQQLRGGAVINSRMATGAGNLRNWITASVMGASSILAVTTDPMVSLAARRLTGLKVNFLADFAKTFTQDRKAALRAGLILDDALRIMGQEARYAGSLSGSAWSQYLVDRMLTWNGLSPWTQARKHVFGMEFQAHVFDHLDRGWQAVDPRLKRAMEGYGLDQTAWQVMQRATGTDGVLRPADILDLAKGPALPDVQKALNITTADAAAAAIDTRRGLQNIADRYLEMILQETERAVPSGTKRSRALLGLGQDGTFLGEAAKSALQFKSFVLSFSLLQAQAISQETASFGRAAGARYAGALLLTMTIGGALGLQLKSIANGRDPEDMQNADFWKRAMATGGGFGIFGDFILADVNRFGYSLASTLAGPSAQLVGDLSQFTVGNISEGLTDGAPNNAGAESVRLMRRWVPWSSHFAIRAGYQRILMDQLQYVVDPAAHRRFRAQARRAQKQNNQRFFWRPGQTAPGRAPDLLEAIGGR
jgi:hypothetical protein